MNSPQPRQEMWCTGPGVLTYHEHRTTECLFVKVSWKVSPCSQSFHLAGHAGIMREGHDQVRVNRNSRQDYRGSWAHGVLRRNILPSAHGKEGKNCFCLKLATLTHTTPAPHPTHHTYSGRLCFQANCALFPTSFWVIYSWAWATHSELPGIPM